ncbi:MAG TPA: class II aldolase/adducin family protein [Chloroflexota bacterium]|nr:class II aldolase/adducin family protein [Chloroflexota bacterium]
MAKSPYERLLRQLVIANRVLARHGVVDSYGHVSIRHPDHPDRFVMARARAPELITEDDFQTYSLAGDELNGDDRKPYSERFIHAGVYEVRPEVLAVCHNHSPSVIPFGTTNLKLRPIFHMAGGIGSDVPVWDIADEFGEGTDLLVSNVAMGRSLARTLGPRPVALMRGHGSVVAATSVPNVVSVAFYMEQNARLATLAEIMGKGDVHYLSDAEARATGEAQLLPNSAQRAWEAWCAQVGMSEDD